MKRVKQILLVLLTAASPLLLQAQTTETFTFTTNRLVPDGSLSGLGDVRNVNSAIGTISSLNVRLKLAGEFNGDVYAYLRHTNGFVILLNRVGRTASDSFGYGDSGFNVTFQNGAVNGDIHVYQNVTTPADGSPLTGIWQPDGRGADPTNATDGSSRSTSLTSFNGLNAAGQWTLFLADMESGGTNMLTEWSLDISGAATPTLTWTNPVDIVYGTALSGTQLNAVAKYNATNVPGTFAYMPAPGTVLNAGPNQTISVTFTPTDSSGFLPVTTNVTINVLKASLNIAANDTNKVYGAALPAFTATYTGFVNGDDTNKLTTQVTLTTSATMASDVATYAIIASGATSSNYNITHMNGTLTITPADLLITAVDKSKVYGAALPILTASYSGFVNGDNASSLDTPVSLGTTATAASPVGTYPITAGGAADLNYSISYVSGTLTVTTAPLLITANDTNKVYGAALPVLSASFAGFVNGDTTNSLTTQPTLVTSATVSSDVGTYSITASGAVGTNYFITYASGTLTVTPASITIAADNKSKAFGAALPTFTATYTGFVLSQGTNDLTALASFSTTATATSDVGTYPITPSGATSTNYSFTYVDGTLTITQSLSAGVIASSVNPAVPGTNVTFTMTVSAVAPGAGTPVGTVDFRIDGAVAGSGTLSGGVATFTTSTLALGSHGVVAEYAGSLNFVGTTNSLAEPQVINTPPIAGNDTIERNPLLTVKVRLATLLANDSDADGDPLNISVSTNSANGATIGVRGGWVFYTPPPGFTNADSFTYTITDGRGGSTTATVTVAVQVDNAPGQNLAITPLGGGSNLISGNGIPGCTYHLQYSETSAPFTWLELTTVTTDSTGQFQYTDTSIAPIRFYRTVYP